MPTTKENSTDPVMEPKLGVLLPGMGAVASTFVAGVALTRRGLGLPIGSLSQMGRISGPNGAQIPIQDFVSLASLSSLVFGGWDVHPDSAYEAAVRAAVLERQHLDLVRDELSLLRPMKAAFFGEHVRRLKGDHVKNSTSRAELVDLLRDDVRGFLNANNLTRAVAIWCGSTEAKAPIGAAHQSIAAFEAAIARNDSSIMSSQLYGWALLKEGVPVADGSPNGMLDFPAAIALSRDMGLPIAGKDLKTGQTLVKSILAPGLRRRLIGIDGWFSINILGNRDGEILDDVESFRAKESTKLGVLNEILNPETDPQLYGKLYHKVCIEYYPPRGDAKEGWDSIDLRGWLGYPMQLKINFLCRDSILAAPLVLDIVLFLDLAHRAGLNGPQEWLNFYFKAPIAERRVEHDLFAQTIALEDKLRTISDLLGHR